MRQTERLIDLINRLESDSRLSATPEFEQASGRSLAHASIFDVSRALLDTGYQDQEAALSADGRMVSISTTDRFTPWLAFTVDQKQKPDIIARKVLMGQDHRYTAEIDASGTLTIREQSGDVRTELHIPAQAARALVNLLRRQVVRSVLSTAKGSSTPPDQAFK